MKSIIFDLDGTLTDSGDGVINSAIVALEHYGYPVPNRADMRFMVGPPLRFSFAKFGVPEDKIGEVIACYRQRYNTIGKFENAPYRGVHQLLAKLRNDGYQLCVATSKMEYLAHEVLDHYDLTPYFHHIVGALNVGVRDTKEAVLAYLLEIIGGAENAIMVGDTIYDVMGAKHHNINTVAVTWGYGVLEEMKTAGVIGIANTMDELYDILTK